MQVALRIPGWKSLGSVTCCSVAFSIGIHSVLEAGRGEQICLS